MNLEIFNFLYSLSANRIIFNSAFFISYVLIYVSMFGLLLWAIFYSKNKMFYFSLFFLTGIVSWVTAHSLKLLMSIQRPMVDIVRVSETGFSFPSEHTTVFVALAWVMFLVNKRWGFVFSVTALAIGLSRIILGVHTPLDIVGGILVGSVVGFLFVKLFKKI